MPGNSGDRKGLERPFIFYRRGLAATMTCPCAGILRSCQKGTQTVPVNECANRCGIFLLSEKVSTSHFRMETVTGH